MSIEKNEHVKPTQASQWAGEFLQFVRQRAGLLVEIGQDRHCFVHLTFQEYFAASFLYKSSVMGGVPEYHRIFVGALWKEPSPP